MSEPLPRSVVTTGLLVGVAAVSTSAILARVAMGDEPGVVSAPAGAAPALAVAFWRTVLGAAALAPAAVRSSRRSATAATRTRWRQLVGSGLGLGLHFALFQGALALTTIASAVTLVTMSPIFVALGGWWFLKEPSTRRTWIGMAITMAGAIAIGAGDLANIDLGPRALVGDAMAFGGALAVTAYLLIGRVARRDVPAVVYSSIVYAVAAAGLLVVCLALRVPLTGYSSTVWLALVGIVVGPQLLGHTVFNALLSSVSATVISIVVLAEPVGAGIFAWLLFDEVPAGPFYLGAPLVLVGVAIAASRRAIPPRPTIPDPATAAPTD